jgi:hypothetical protein
VARRVIVRVKVIACEVMKEELTAAAAAYGPGCPDLEFVPQGLHYHPEKLNLELQNRLDAVSGYSRVVLAFGLCGGGAKSLKAGDFILTIPKVHDCISLLLGSRQRYDEARQEEPGTLYLSGGWVEGEAPVISEYGRTVARYGEKRAAGLLKRIYNAYRRVLFISTGSIREDEHVRRSIDAASLLELDFQRTEWDPGFIRRLLSGPWDDGEFISLPPFGVIDELSFLECGA